MSPEKSNLERSLEFSMDDLIEKYGYKKEGVKEIKNVPEKRKQTPAKKKPKQTPKVLREVAKEFMEELLENSGQWRSLYKWFIGKELRGDFDNLLSVFIPIIQFNREIFGSGTRKERQDAEIVLGLIKKLKNSIGGE